METRCPTSVRLGRIVLAAAIGIVLSAPVYAAETKPADNTAQNSRDAAGNEVTPLDQSPATADVEITRSIRKLLVDDDTLGTNAQNVKVITVDGKVTLRGPVATTDEQTRVVAIANQVAGAHRVVNELQVIKR